MPTIISGAFEWDSEKARSNRGKHGVSFEEAARAMGDPLAIDFDDTERPENLVTLAMSPQDRILYVVTTQRGERSASSVPAEQPAMSDASTKKANDEADEPSAASLEAMPGIDAARFRRRPGRGHHAHLQAGELAAIEPDLWSHFGSSEAVNAALRGLVEAARHMRKVGP